MEPFKSEWPEWSPKYLTEWIGKVRNIGSFPAPYLDYLLTLASDNRMRHFWDWLAEVGPTRRRHIRSAITVGHTIHRATHLPGKPSNMAPMQRAEYFKKVQKHCLALHKLLQGTIFDNFDAMRELTEAELDAPLSEKLYSWGDDESDDGHVLAFNVSRDGIYEFSYDYPRSNLMETLGDLYEWTLWDDQWDGRLLSSSAPIAQSNSERVRVIYFTCSVHDWFAGYGMEIPFSVLATIANVALSLGPDDQVDEDAVRKQVRRHQARQANKQAEHPTASDEATGHNSSDSEDSVLSDPF